MKAEGKFTPRTNQQKTRHNQLLYKLGKYQRPWAEPKHGEGNGNGCVPDYVAGQPLDREFTKAEIALDQRFTDVASPFDDEQKRGMPGYTEPTPASGRASRSGSTERK